MLTPICYKVLVAQWHRKRRAISSLAPPLRGEDAAVPTQSGTPASSTAQQHGFLPAPDSAFAVAPASSSMPPSSAASASAAWQLLGQGGGLHSSQQPQTAPTQSSYELHIPASAASAAASLTLQPAWAGSLGGSSPPYRTASETLLEQFSYPSLLPSLQQVQLAAYAEQNSLHAPQTQPALMLPPVRLPIGQQSAVFLPSPHGDPVSTAPGSSVATGLLRSPSGSADQRQALRGAALRQALHGSTSFQPSSMGGVTLQTAKPQQANGHAGLDEHREVTQPQLQPPLSNASEQFLLDQRMPSPLGILHSEQPQLQLLPQADASRQLPSHEKQRAGNNVCAHAPPTATPTQPHAASMSSNGKLSGTLRLPSSPAKPSQEQPGLEALRRKLRTSSDRCVCSCTHMQSASAV